MSKSKIIDDRSKNGGMLCHLRPLMSLCMNMQYIKSAYRALEANKVRAFLTALGIVIGIVTVVMVFALGQGTQALIESELDAYGANTIVVEVSVPGISHTSPANAASMAEGVTINTLKEEDMEAVLKIPGVTGAYAGVFGLEKVVSIYDDQSYLIQGNTTSFIDIDQAEVEFGRFFTEAEDQSLSRVAVLGYSAAQELFPDVDPIGQNVRIRDVNFKVIGVMEELGVVFFQDMDDQVYVPLNTLQKLVMGIDYIPYFLVQVETEEIALLIKDDINQLMDYRHQIKDPDKRDFHTTTMQEAAEIMSTVTGALQILLVVLAAISLVVGGVGVMNIMYVAVTERTREIGLRKALGASPRAILLQFLWESVMITAIGGVIGVLAAIAIVWLAVTGAAYGGVDMPFHIPVAGVVLAVGASVVEGVVFGLYPARRAAKLNPIDSLRFE